MLVHVTGAAAASPRALILATVSFALSFAAWGLVGGLAPVFTGLYGLTASETALLVAVPVLLGSLARLPMGMLTDRFGAACIHRAPRVLPAAFVASSPPATARCSWPLSSSVRLVLFAVGVRVPLTPAPGRHRPGVYGWHDGHRWPSSSVQ
jgi:NNP family nitrate/nitrite transporter-like MFS transporter